MPIQFPCRRCGQINTAATALAGQEVDCGRCLEPLTVPIPTPRPPSSSAPSAAPAEVRFQCPRCGLINTAPANAGGRVVECRRCLDELVVPSSASLDPPGPGAGQSVGPATAPVGQAGRSPTIVDASIWEPEPPPPDGAEPEIDLYAIFTEVDLRRPPPVPSVVETAPESPVPSREEVRPRRGRRSRDRSIELDEGWKTLMVTLVVGVPVAMTLGAAIGTSAALILTCALFLVAVLLILWGGLLSLIIPFQESAACGLCYLFVPFYCWYYLATRFREMGQPFLTSMAGSALFYSTIAYGVVYADLKAWDRADSPLLAHWRGPRPKPVVPEAPRIEVAPVPPPPAPPREALEQANKVEGFAAASRDLLARYPPERVLRLTVAPVSSREEAAGFETALRPPGEPGSFEFLVDPGAGPGRLEALLAPVDDLDAFCGSISIGSPVLDRPARRVIVTPSGQQAEPPPRPMAFGRPRRPSPETPRDLPTGGELALPVLRSAFESGVVFPATSTDFVAVGGNGLDNEVRESWDLRARRRVGALKGRLEIAKPFAMSPDGTKLAGLAPGGRRVEVWSFLTDDVAHRIDIELAWVDYLAFADPGRLVVGSINNQTFEVWDLETGQRTRQIVVPVGLSRESPTISADGKALAVASSPTSSVGVFSLETGKLLVDGAVRQVEGFFAPSCAGLTFSPDASEVSGLFENLQAARIMTWDIPTKKLTYDRVIPRSRGDVPSRPFRSEGPALQYLSGLEGWLVGGRAVLERRTCRLAWTVPTGRDDLDGQVRRTFGEDRLVAIGGDSNKAKVVRSVPLDRDATGQAIRALSAPVNRRAGAPGRTSARTSREMIESR